MCCPQQFLLKSDVFQNSPKINLFTKATYVRTFVAKELAKTSQIWSDYLGQSRRPQLTIWMYLESHNRTVILVGRYLIQGVDRCK